MSARLKKSSPQMLLDFDNAISSPGSPAGVLPCVSPEFLRKPNCGPEAVPASRSAQRESSEGNPTNGICGQPGSISSRSAALNEFLVSRCRARFDSVGSMEYAQTWKRKATPSGRSYWEHTARARRISDKDFTGWPSPLADKLTPQTREDFTPNLAYVATQTLTGYPTPRSEDAESSGERIERGVADTLTAVARQAPSGWPSPKTPMGGGNSKRAERGAGGPDLQEVAGMAKPGLELPRGGVCRSDESFETHEGRTSIESGGSGGNIGERMGSPIRSGLEGHTGDVADGNEPGRVAPGSNGPTAAAGSPGSAWISRGGDGVGQPHGGFWDAYYIIHFIDGKTRRIEPGTQPLVNGVSARVVRLRGYGNAIVPPLAAAFIKACLEAEAIANPTPF